MKTRTSLFLYLSAFLATACGGSDAPGSDPDAGEKPEPRERRNTVEPGEALAGGDTTVFETGVDAFLKPAANLDLARRSEFFAGEALFDAEWFPAPHDRAERDGLGPLFNSISCHACHFNNGRGMPAPADDAPMVSMLIRLSVPGTDTTGAPAPEPTYGDQLQPRGTPGVPGEGRVQVSYEVVDGTFADGTPYQLRRPIFAFEDLGYGPMADGLQTSPRIAQPMIGLGLLEAIPEARLRALADPDDADGDGISGRVNEVWSVREKGLVVGRFGWKSNQPTVEQQSAGAFLGDMGITTPLFPNEACTAAQQACAGAPSGGVDGKPDIAQKMLTSTTFYSAMAAVPARRGHDDPQVLEGKDLFHFAGCASCHVPSHETGDHAAFPELARQAIWPYTDLLLHDMGEGLADGRPDFVATGSEWRTAPLWGIGLTETVNGAGRYLHDGRARTLAEAILWHGGEAAGARDAFLEMENEERDQLLAFLGSL